MCTSHEEKISKFSIFQNPTHYFTVFLRKTGILTTDMDASTPQGIFFCILTIQLFLLDNVLMEAKKQHFQLFLD